MNIDTIVRLKTDKNPYEVNSPEWHCLLDLQCSADVFIEGKSIIKLKTVMKQHGMLLEYYRQYLPILVKDGIIDVC